MPRHFLILFPPFHHLVYYNNVVVLWHICSLLSILLSRCFPIISFLLFKQIFLILKLIFTKDDAQIWNILKIKKGKETLVSQHTKKKTPFYPMCFIKYTKGDFFDHQLQLDILKSINQCYWLTMHWNVNVWCPLAFSRCPILANINLLMF